MAQKYFSRKFILTLLIAFLSVGAPLMYKNNGVSDNIVMAVLVILGGIGAAYGFVNVKASESKKE